MIREEPCPRCFGIGSVDLWPPSANLRSPCDFCKGNKKILRMIEEAPSLSEQVIDLRKRIEKLEATVRDNAVYVDLTGELDSLRALRDRWRAAASSCRVNQLFNRDNLAMAKVYDQAALELDTLLSTFLSQ